MLTDAVAHIPSGLVGAEARDVHDLKRAHPLHAGQHQVDDTEPVTERLVLVLEDRPGDVGEAVVGAIR